MKRVLAIVIALVLCASLCISASAEEDWTILVYICNDVFGGDYMTDYVTFSMENGEPCYAPS